MYNGYNSNRYIGYNGFNGFIRNVQHISTLNIQPITTFSSQPTSTFSVQPISALNNQATSTFTNQPNDNQELSSPNQQPKITTSFKQGEVNADKYAVKVLNSTVSADSRVKASNDLTSPTAAAALAYLQSNTKEGLCGLPTETYLETIFSGKSKEEANAAAARIYIKAYNDGENIPQSGACAAADAAYREAFRKGDDPILESALAFVNNWPGAKDGNPCAVSGIEYMKAIIAGIYF